jgi:hypothetical protein
MVRQLDAQHLAGLQGRGIAGSQRRPLAQLEPYLQYDWIDLEAWTQRVLLGFAVYPFPNDRATRNLRLKSEAGFDFPESESRVFVWFFQLTTGF